jgi:hypothetical protein
MKKFMVIFGILAMVWFQSCQTPYNNIDLENESQNNGTVTEQTNGENQNDNGNNENPSTNEDSNSEENGQDENQEQVEHICKGYFEIEVGEDWTTFEYVARDVGEVAYHNCNRIWSNYLLDGIDSNNKTIYIRDDSGSVRISFTLMLNNNEDKILITSDYPTTYEVYDVIRNENGNTVELQFRTK